MKPKLIIIAGPNGSGKTSVTGKILNHQWIEGCEYINPDTIAQEKFGDWNSLDAVLSAALRLVDRAYIYDNSVDFTDPRLLFKVIDGQLYKKYDTTSQWALPILSSLSDYCTDA